MFGREMGRSHFWMEMEKNEGYDGWEFGMGKVGGRRFVCSAYLA